MLASISSDSGALTAGSKAKAAVGNVCSLFWKAAVNERDRSASSCGSKSAMPPAGKSPKDASPPWLFSANPASAMAGSTEGSSRPSLSACAARTKADAFQALASPASMSAAQQPKPSNVCRASCSSGASMGFCSASQRLNTCSMDQAASPNSCSPTMRELPLSV